MEVFMNIVKRKKEYKFHEINQVERKFERFFGIRFTPYFDSLMSVVFKRIIIDVVKFDNYLLNKYHYDQNKDISMAAFIINKFGVDAWYFVKSLL